MGVWSTDRRETFANTVFRFLRAADDDDPSDPPCGDERDLYLAVLLSAIRDLHPVESADYNNKINRIILARLAKSWLLGETGDGITVTFAMCAEALELSDDTIHKIQTYALESTLGIYRLHLAPGRKRKYRLKGQPFRKKTSACT